ncbi:MAG: hypothetical protein J0I49_23875 [Pseudonocardia sp.]|uniref:hypothetical protein n=1 Tax=Pseudonocardia sp. TaxID=60912 RepID=UPI001AD16014|nr:hypothetical protein [Pseudonocardia sp.]MBN9101121.1 hypothetical protein [Pseudonocardia sp.]
MSVQRVLVAGAGIAGSTLAWWRGRHDVETTEPGRRPRSALAKVEQMNLLAPLREAATLVDVYADSGCGCPSGGTGPRERGSVPGPGQPGAPRLLVAGSDDPGR